MADTQTQIVRLSGFGEAKVSEIVGPSKSACEKHLALRTFVLFGRMSSYQHGRCTI